ncbi:bacterio-opsin activator domain-containing protein [Halosolutus gelatinilyticus]|uniref:bacterio-opsin activator domain-containing protein n=1 Tax=Halosolutus gelatinilyticus TaxID=2931975 RepID=UPI001FF6FAFF|nr:bacterio-opsin activator domain-containing protein [Halosolutus gelatinilyticus]
MNVTQRDGRIVLITASDERQRRLEAILRRELSGSVRSIEPETDLRSELDVDRDPEEVGRESTAAGADPDAGIDATARPIGIVIALNGPDEIRRTVRRVRTVVSAPTVVVPKTGSERAATAAYRAGATAYVAEDEDVVARVVETIRSQPSDAADRSSGRSRESSSRRTHFETLTEINAVVRDVIETLVEAPTREAIEREVCDRLAESELYCGAWIAGRTGDRRLAYRIGAGRAEATLDRVTDVGAETLPTVRRAVATDAVQADPCSPGADATPEPLSDAIRADGVRSILAVPISYDSATYGVLTVFTSRCDDFSGSEQAGFRLLGETIGFTIQAVKNRQLLFADTVVELEFRIDGGETFSFDLSSAYDCRCSLEWAGTTASGRSFQFVTVEGLDGETVLAEARDHESVEECRLIRDGMGRCTIEMRLSESGVRTLANHGATIRDVTVEDGVGACVVEVPQDAPVREIAEALTAVYENTELVARRQIDRPVRTAAERRNRIVDQLTERQHTTLRLAYYGGFFDWPRESTGEEIAEAMDVSPPTMHQHLRKGLKTVLGEFFEAGGGTD